MKPNFLILLSLSTSILAAPVSKRTTESSAASTDALAQALPGIAPIKRDAAAEPQDPTSLLKSVPVLGSIVKREAEAEPQDPTSLLKSVPVLGGIVKERDAAAEPQDPTSLLKGLPVVGSILRRGN